MRGNSRSKRTSFLFAKLQRKMLVNFFFRCINSTLKYDGCTTHRNSFIWEKLTTIFISSGKESNGDNLKYFSLKHMSDFKNGHTKQNCGNSPVMVV